MPSNRTECVGRESMAGSSFQLCDYTDWRRRPPAAPDPAGRRVAAPAVPPRSEPSALAGRSDVTGRRHRYTPRRPGGRSSMAEPQPSKLMMRVRSSSAALNRSPGQKAAPPAAVPLEPSWIPGHPATAHNASRVQSSRHTPRTAAKPSPPGPPGPPGPPKLDRSGKWQTQGSSADRSTMGHLPCFF